jgi:hypothetical protein
MHSVQSSFNQNPPPPRLFTTNDVELRGRVDFFGINTTVYYDVINFTVEQLKTILKRKVTYKGEMISVAGKYLVNLHSKLNTKR